MQKLYFNYFVIIATKTLDSILRYILEIKLMCKRIDERLHVSENNGNNINIPRNIDMLPQLPMDCFEDINNFEIILASEEAQSQLVCVQYTFLSFFFFLKMFNYINS